MILIVLYYTDKCYSPVGMSFHALVSIVKMCTYI